MCGDYTKLNKASPKDPYPLPDLNRTVDVTIGHELLSFMDALSKYNQIKMYRPNEEKTVFVTDQGVYCARAMPFRLKNAGVTF